MDLNLPNLLTLSRIGMIPVIVLLSFLTFPLKHVTIGSLYLIACFTDFLDGHLARKSSITSNFGRIMDPVSDKLLVISVVVILLANDTLQGLHIIAAMLIILREVFVSGLREFLSEVKIIMPPSQLAKWKTAAQMIALAMLILSPNLPHIYKNISLALLWIAVLITLKTGYNYLRIGLPHLNKEQ